MFRILLLFVFSGNVWAEAVFLYLEKGPGLEPFLSKYTLDDKYLRIDSGLDGGFVLFDRKKREIYSVSGFDKTIMVLNHKPGVLKAPIKIDFKVEPVELKATLFTAKLKHHRFFANGQRCNDLFTIDVATKGLEMALKSFYEILALEHVRVLQSTPVDIVHACDISLHVTHSRSRVHYGLPSHEIDYTGKERLLLDFDLEYQTSPGWWELPKGYEQYHPGQIRGIDLDA